MVAAGTKHHVDDEESDVFPQLRERAADRLGALDPEELERQVRSGDGRPPDEPTKEELYEQAREAGIEGRSAMTKEELSRALSDQDR
ncbi:MAG: Rho termination factor N-terminal domain-containing protein [Acidimicrobiia bacterium]|nr:Rho termination factor N-terminal domain-containing protein [Acidimicrobiia bacterium]